ncbi:Lactose permease [Fusarium oxysporum f. sp. albedinis]|nr:Lactose permease [Fusarium oxysporum f. sp. albedinis]KAK2468178.1 hypothetical protein H9L39_20400 [Fusarium oxysporum f. sp. albedinis]
MDTAYKVPVSSGESMPPDRDLTSQNAGLHGPEDLERPWLKWVAAASSQRTAADGSKQVRSLFRNADTTREGIYPRLTGLFMPRKLNRGDQSVSTPK